ncbi:PGG domain-containing protein [Citrus sinensis]|uniref:PGG domain-containing protein n=1 Tax=Citrus sinensis TaxID=2711 RepID=A0ACB8NDF1_CITSI|nr:PGG domain-containing protein [Citrus sinensis]
MSGLIEQQDILITLVEQIAHGGHATTKKDAVTSSCDDTPAPADQKLPELTRSRRLQTYRAALNGDWAVAKSIYDVYEGEIGIAIAKRGDTALRIAAAGKYIEFVKELVKIMEAEDLAKPNKHGGTALSYAAASGRENVALQLCRDRPKLATLRAGDCAEDVEVQRLQALKLVERLCGKVALLSDSEISRLISKPGALIFDAAKQGNVGFLLILTREYPNLEVEKVVQRGFAEAKNREGLTPRALFTKEHKDLRETGEKWMKDTATSCMFVATLIATVVFVAAFTVPRSNREDTGFPFFLEKFSENFSFKIFAISDAISLVSSSASVVNFLSILTPRYAEEDFLRLLPRKLLLGLATLFISVAAMMVVFSTTFFILLAQETLWIAILVSVIASTPVILFIWQHFRLFYDVLRSTYVSGSLFQIGKTSLFRKEGETSERQNNTKIFNAHWEIQCTCSTNV